ncbi:porin family protein [Altibacter sp. HG106]|uniref:porin family protein n=1 Tax=Altibacter sp. HG106 TaxID=3023937 RepID=UPI002350D59A|nr:porin family protein [Altibacter sp. HG106]MDC7995778.1 porin family protein [Altibacter sp. HG106]
MKKHCLLVFVLALFSLTAMQAQEFVFGAKAGVNLASLSGDIEGDSKSRLAFHLGGVGEFKFSDAFGLQAELLYSGTGAKFEESESFDGETFTAEATTRLSYLSVPLLGRYHINDNFSLEAGPQVSILISAEEEYSETITFDGETESFSETVDISDGLNTLDVGFAAGATFTLPQGIFFSARYVVGLTSIDTFGEADVKNNVFQLSAGYQFN